MPADYKYVLGLCFDHLRVGGACMLRQRSKSLKVGRPKIHAGKKMCLRRMRGNFCRAVVVVFY